MSEEKKKRSFFKSKIFILILLVVFGLVAFAYGRAYYQDYEVKLEIARLQEEVHNLEFKKLESLEILKYVQSPAFAEEKARLELNMAKPGEKMAVINSEEKTQQQGGQEKEKVVEWDNTSNIIKWWDYFLGRDKNI